MPLKSPFCTVTSLLSPFVDDVILLIFINYLDYIRSFHASTLEEFSYGAQLWDTVRGLPHWIASLGARYERGRLCGCGCCRGGPAGSCCARELALRGFHTLLLEEHKTVASKVLCTGIIGINAFEEFPLPWESMVGTPGRMKAISRYGTELLYTPPQPIAYIVDKGAFNSALATQASDAGALLHTSPRAYDLVIDDAGVHLQALVGGEQPLRVHAQLAVLACGVHYHLTKALGLGIPCEFLQGAQAEVPQTLTKWTEVHLNKTFSRAAFAWLVPLQSGYTRVGSCVHAMLGERCNAFSTRSHRSGGNGGIFRLPLSRLRRCPSVRAMPNGFWLSERQQGR